LMDILPAALYVMSLGIVGMMGSIVIHKIDQKTD